MVSAKFCRMDGDELVRHEYDNLYFRQPCGDAERLVIGPARDHVELMAELAGELQGHPWFVLYVLLVPRLGCREPGRYESEPFHSLVELVSFLQSFRAFFEEDGRHHVWVGSASNHGLLVYDHHNVIFAYGPLTAYEAVLSGRGFHEKSFWFPAPHSHAFVPECDAEEERLMAEIAWKYFPLQPGDDWD